MPYVYRVETEKGIGPWCNADQDWGQGAGADCFLNAQSLHYDLKEYHQSSPVRKSWRFGFYCFEHMFHYMCSGTEEAVFLRLLGVMRSRGLGISVYKVSTFSSVGDSTQCIFDHENSVRIRRIDPTGDEIRQRVAAHCALTKTNKIAAVNAQGTRVFDD